MNGIHGFFYFQINTDNETLSTVNLRKQDRSFAIFLHQIVQDVNLNLPFIQALFLLENKR